MVHFMLNVAWWFCFYFGIALCVAVFERDSEKHNSTAKRMFLMFIASFLFSVVSSFSKSYINNQIETKINEIRMKQIVNDNPVDLTTESENN